jgi:hypothetical protein
VERGVDDRGVGSEAAEVERGVFGGGGGVEIGEGADAEAPDLLDEFGEVVGLPR